MVRFGGRHPGMVEEPLRIVVHQQVATTTTMIGSATAEEYVVTPIPPIRTRISPMHLPGYQRHALPPVLNWSSTGRVYDAFARHQYHNAGHRGSDMDQHSARRRN
jgi:hypothetical protein